MSVMYVLLAVHVNFVNRSSQSFFFADAPDREKFVIETKRVISRPANKQTPASVMMGGPLTVFVGSWNLGNCLEVPASLLEFIRPNQYDIYAIGLQENDKKSRCVSIAVSSSSFLELLLGGVDDYLRCSCIRYAVLYVFFLLVPSLPQDHKLVADAH